MNKNCICGSAMEITLRTLYFNKKVEIKNVPVYSCPACHRHEIIEQVKFKIKDLISTHIGAGKKVTVHFEELSELAQLLMMVREKQEYPFREEWMIQEELEELLESMLVYGTYKDLDWSEKIHKKIEKMLH